MRLQRPGSGRGGRRAALLGIVAIVAVQQTLSLDGSVLGRVLTNMMHVPMFAAILVLLHRGFPTLPIWRLAVIAGVIGVGSEALQTLTWRSASLADLGLDLVGIGIAAAAMMAVRFRGREAAPTSGMLPRPVVVWGIAIASIAAVVAVPALPVIQVYNVRDSAFPILWSPGWDSATRLLRGDSAYRLVTAPAEAGPMAGRPALEIAWSATRYPRVSVVDVVDDWSRHGTLTVEVFLPEGPPQSLIAAAGLQGETVAKTLGKVSLEAGFQRLHFDLDARLDTAERQRVERIVIRAPREAAGRWLLVGELRLGPTRSPQPQDLRRARRPGFRGDLLPDVGVP